jgi:N-acetylneuraminic acid mutarotase
MFGKCTKMLFIGVIALLAVNNVQADWVQKAPIPTARRAPGAVEVGEKIYVIGGCGGPRANEEYNPATNSWATKTSLPQPKRRGMGAVAGAVNGKVYFMGGHQGPPPGQTVNFNDEYDPTTNSWTTKASMPSATEGAAVAVVNGKIYVIGGYSGTSFLEIVQEYDPATNSWATKNPMPTSRAYIAGAVVDGKIYVIGGFNGSCLNTVQEYDPETDSWTDKAQMPTGRYWLAADAVAGKIYVVGGYGESGYLNINEVYDPATDSWSTEESMPTTRSHVVAVESNGKIYAIAGVLPDGTFTDANEEFSPAVGIEDEQLLVGFSLAQNYPNPFNPETTISFLTTESTENTEIIIYNLKGQIVKKFIIHNPSSIIPNQIIWNGKDESNNPVTSGIYFYRIKSTNSMKTKKMTLLR